MARIVRGNVADGSAVSGSNEPVLIAGTDGSAVQTMRTTDVGNPRVVLVDINDNSLFTATTATDAVDTTGRRQGTNAAGYVFNGTTWDRARSASGDGLAATGISAAGNLIFNGATWDRVLEGNVAGSVLMDMSDDAARDLGLVTVDGTVDITELPAAAASADATANPTITQIGSYRMGFNGTTWDRLRTATGDGLASTGLAASGTMIFNGVTWDRVLEGNVAGSVLTDISDDAARVLGLVDLGANNDVDTELPAAAALAEATATPTTPTIGAFNQIFNGATWDFMREGAFAGSVLTDMEDDATRDLGIVTVDGTITADNVTGAAADGAAVSGNPVLIAGFDGVNVQTLRTSTAGTINVAISDNSTSTPPTITNFSADGRTVGLNILPVLSETAVFNGTTYDKMRGNTTGTQLIGGLAHDAANTAANNPFVGGFEAIAHGTNPTAVAAADVTRWYANRAGVPFVIGGHPNIITTEYLATTAQTDDPIVSVGAGAKIVVTEIDATTDNATTVDVGVRVGFGTAAVPALPADGAAVAGVVLSHAGIPPGSGMMRGDGSGILGIGADDEDLRITNEVPTTGALRVIVSYYTVPS